MSIKYLICSLGELQEPGSRAFQIANEASTLEGFIVRWQGQVRAFVNRCPHTGVALNWTEHQFLSWDEQYIQCALHGALFEPATGYCVHGPCQGQSLSPLEVTVDGQDIYVVSGGNG